MSDNEELTKRLKLVTDSTILLVKSGSKSYGTNIRGSDEDFKGVCLIPDLKLFLGMSQFEQQEKGWQVEDSKIDKVIYHLPKFMKLLLASNPTALEMLFCDESDIISITDAGHKLRENRHLFITKKVKHTYTGFCHGQMQRLKSHKRWLDNPVEKPELNSAKHIKQIPVGPLGTHISQSGFIKNIIREEQGWHTLEVEVLDKGSYEATKRDYDNYCNWLETRNPERLKLEMEYGYDGKFALHTVRLLRTCYELLTEGKLLVRRPDAEELISIRRGAWTYDYLIKYVDEMLLKIEEAEKTSSLPWGVDTNKIEALQIEMVHSALKDAGQL
jgi:uncharacterized protein